MRELAEFLFPIGDLDDAANALAKIDGSQAEKVCRQGVWGLNDAEAQIRRVNLQLLGDLVELDFLAEARLRSAMSALGSAGRLVREGAAALIAIARNVIRGGLQCAGIKRACDSVRAVGATVDQRLEVHSGDGAVLFDAGFEFHQDRMAAARTIKYLFACQADFDGPVKQKRSLRHDDFV